MDDINAIRDFTPPREGGGTYLKLEDGESVKVRISTLPVIYQNLYKDPVKGDKLSTQFAFVVWNFDETCAQIWQTNSATYAQQIKPLLDPVDDTEEADWRKFDVRITRTGIKAQTRYNVKAGTKVYELEPDELQECNMVDLVAEIDKSPNTSNVMWLTEWRAAEERSKNQSNKIISDTKESLVSPTASSIRLDTLDGDEPIDLNDIPF